MTTAAQLRLIPIELLSLLDESECVHYSLSESKTGLVSSCRHDVGTFPQSRACLSPEELLDRPASTRG
jgi:hypothetical protein